MRVLVVGNGGREHALLVALARSSAVSALLATRPNAGMAPMCQTLDIAPTDVLGVAAAAREHGVDLVVVGPEAPLVDGLADRLRAAGIAVLGPSAAAAQLEGSKRFAKEIMAEAGVPTAAYGAFRELEPALAWVRAQGRPMVVKADGLAAGKGVIVAESVTETEDALRRILSDRAFGAAGAEVIVEERLEGPELSVIALVDGTTVRTFPPARDHKRAFDGDRGPNTGGMGAFTPVPDISADQLAEIERTVLQPTVAALAARGIEFRGFLYAGLMLTPDGPRVLEFNCRMGDPECQPVLARLRSDAGAVFYAAATGQLDGVTLEFDARPAVCVVLASGGYPGSYPKGLPIAGLDAASAIDGVTVYHAGTRMDGGRVITSGGRVLGVCALGDDVRDAIGRAYAAADLIRFDGKQLRTDIARSAL